MRALVLALAISFSTSGIMSAADQAQTAQNSVEFAKKVVLAVKAEKDKTGKAPTSVTIQMGGKTIELKCQVTLLTEGFSISTQPTADSKNASPMQSANIDANVGDGGATLVSLVGTGADGSDVVAFATTGTELSVTVSTDDKSTTTTTTTNAADIPALGSGTVISQQQPVQDNTPPVALTITEPVVENHDTTTDNDLSSINEINVPDMQRIGDGQPLVSSDADIPTGFDASGFLTVEGNLADGSSPTQDPVSPE